VSGIKWDNLFYVVPFITTVGVVAHYGLLYGSRNVLYEPQIKPP